MGTLVDINYYKNKLNALEKKEGKWHSGNHTNYNSDIAPLTDKSHTAQSNSILFNPRANQDMVHSLHDKYN